MNLEQSEAGAAGFYRGLEVVAGYMESVSGLIQGVTVLHPPPRRVSQWPLVSLLGMDSVTQIAEQHKARSGAPRR
jgi:hypothetical protein